MLSPKLSPEMRGFLEAAASQGGPAIESLPAPEARQVAHHLKPLGGEPEPVAQIADRKVLGRSGEIPIRVYAPDGDGPFPGVVFLHGGGWVLCDLDTHDTICRAISKRAGCVVVAVDYRLAPEHKFPAALDDCFDVTRWVASNAPALRIDPKRLVLAGDSAGGNMATVIASKSRNGGPSVALQVLVYPVINMTSFDTPSHREFPEGHFVTRSSMEWFKSNYFSSASDTRNPDASPYFIENLNGMPPALVLTAECDPLRDEGEAYAKRLQASGTAVTLTRYDGMIHPFLNFMGISAGAQKAIDQIAAAVRALQ